MEEAKPVTKKPVWKCVQCGSCCFMYGCMVPATDEDMTRWKQEGRQDLLDMTMVIRDPGMGRIIAAELWFHPQTRKEYIYCPWIKKQKSILGKQKTICQIHDTKPQYCRDYICRKHLK